MSRDKKRALQHLAERKQSQTANNHCVDSLLDCMVDGRELSSIIDKIPKADLNLLDEVAEGIKAIESVRNRPCIMYVGNVVSRSPGEASIDSTDELPFKELVASVPMEHNSIDVYLATNGGSGEQISRFVNCLRQRFDEVNFLIPSACMSAGTLFALSGERIYMTSSAFLGPIDPQVPCVDGRFVPAQALLILVDQLRKDGEEALKNGENIPWTSVRLIDTLDKKELGAAITASLWSKTLAEQYLYEYKFKSWQIRESSQQAVTQDYKKKRAGEIAAALVSHERWKNHGHSISRDILWNEIQLKIDHPDQHLERAMVRLWALLNWIFDKADTQKIICSADYRYTRTRVQR